MAKIIDYKPRPTIKDRVNTAVGDVQGSQPSFRSDRPRPRHRGNRRRRGPNRVDRLRGRCIHGTVLGSIDRRLLLAGGYRILTHELGGIKLQALKVDDVEAAVTRRTIPADERPTPRKGRGRTATSALSRNSLIKLRSTLSQALTWAQRRDLVTRNVAALAELPTGATNQRNGKSLSIEQARQILAAAAGTELEAMWTLMLYLGLRPGEAAGLSWNDIDFTNGTIHIWRARTTNTDGSVAIGNTKTPGSIRTLEAPQVVLDALERHRQRQDDHAATQGPAWANPDNLV